jgi:hypothetical protein
MIGQSKMQSNTDHICYTLLYEVRSFAAHFTSRSKLPTYEFWLETSRFKSEVKTCLILKESCKLKTFIIVKGEERDLWTCLIGMQEQNYFPELNQHILTFFIWFLCAAHTEHRCTCSMSNFGLCFNIRYKYFGMFSGCGLRFNLQTFTLGGFGCGTFFSILGTSILSLKIKSCSMYTLLTPKA